MVVPQGSTLTSTKTIARRNKVLDQVRGVVSGNDSNQQLRWEVRKLRKEERQQILKDDGITIDITPEAGFGVKADLHCSNTQDKTMFNQTVYACWNMYVLQVWFNRWLKTWGISLADYKREQQCWLETTRRQKL